MEMEVKTTIEKKRIERQDVYTVKSEYGHHTMYNNVETEDEAEAMKEYHKQQLIQTYTPIGKRVQGKNGEFKVERFDSSTN